MKDRRKKIFFTVFCLLIAAVAVYPYFGMGVNIEHDTSFHLSRIQALAQSISDGNLFPKIFPYQNNNFGYASPLFYCNLFLLIPAFLVNMGVSLASSYQIFLFIVTFFTALMMGICVYRVFENDDAALLSSCLYVFSLYRLTDIYVRGAMGEVLAFIFLPVALYGIYEVVLSDDKQWSWLCAGFTGLLLTHNISFVMMVAIFGLIICFRLTSLIHQKKRMMAIVKAAACSVGLCSFFLWPMIEQMMSQRMYMHSFASGFDLQNYAMNAWQFTEQTLNFNTSDVNYGPGEAMTTNLGILIPLLPLLNVFVFEKTEPRREKLMIWMAWIGYGAYFMCSRLFPWEIMTGLRIVQFPWRFMIIADLFLVPLAAVSTERFFKKYRKRVTAVLICISLSAGIVRMDSVRERPFVLDRNDSHNVLLDGTLLDPYYGNSFFVRTEIAGADYLPVSSTDYKTETRCVTDPNGRELVCNLKKKGTVTEFDYSGLGAGTVMQLPITYYKGYKAWIIDQDGEKHYVKVTRNENTGLLQINNENMLSGHVVVEYGGTLIQFVSELITAITLIVIIFSVWSKKKKSRAY